MNCTRTWLSMGLAALASVGMSLAPSTLTAQVRVGDAAPEFHGTDSNGKAKSLAEYKGKYVVLEWANKGCPYEQKHYKSGNMEQLQKEWTARGVVWLSIISSAPGQQGYVSPAEENEYLREMHAAPTAAILDPSGAIGHLYAAKTTPHMFIIDPGGKVIYQGALDDKPTPDPASLNGARNYVSQALTEAMAGKAVTTPQTQSYGCSVKYGN